jgi:flagellar basal-body rod protein FlgF
MNPLMASAASGMRARLESLDTLANNLANMATAGYKTDRESYSTYMAPEALEPALDGDSPMPSTLPVVERNWTDFSQGTLTPTGNPLDLALGSKGFFVVNGPSGALYTRNGSFHLSAAGVLTTQDGYAVRGVNGLPIQTQGRGTLEISTAGTIQQDGVAVGQLAVVTMDKPGSVEKTGGNYFRAAGSEANPSPATDVEVHQGKLEASNVTTPETAVRLVNLLRQFEMLQKAAMLGADMDQRAVQDVARVNP